MGSFDSIPSDKAGTPASSSSSPKKDVGFNLESIKDKWLNSDDILSKLVTLIIGEDGSGKSGIALDYLSDEDIKAGKRMLVIDLDGGCDSILISHHKERCEKFDRKLSDVYLLQNPLEEDNEGNIDYKKTFNNIREGIFLAKKAWKELNIKAIVFDGLSSAIKHAENQMRLEKNLDADGGVSLRYWLIRNKIFIELLEQIKSLPISSFFIAHEDFILKTNEDNSSIKIKTNALAHQKVICKRKDDAINKKINFTATIMKSKYKAGSEGSVIKILEVNKDTKTYAWNTKELFEALI